MESPPISKQAFPVADDREWRSPRRSTTLPSAPTFPSFSPMPTKKRTTKPLQFIGYLKIPLHAVVSIHMERNPPQYDQLRDDAGLPAFRVDPGKMTVVVDMAK